MKYDTTYKVNHLKTKCHAIGSIWYPFKTYSFLFDKDCYSVRKHEQTRYKAVSIPLRNIIGCWCWISLKQYFLSVRFCHATFKPCYFSIQKFADVETECKNKTLRWSPWIKMDQKAFLIHWYINHWFLLRIHFGFWRCARDHFYFRKTYFERP